MTGIVAAASPALLTKFGVHLRNRQSTVRPACLSLTLADHVDLKVSAK